MRDNPHHLGAKPPEHPLAWVHGWVAENWPVCLGAAIGWALGGLALLAELGLL